MHNDRIAGTLAPWLRRAMAVIALALAACGGGGDGGSAPQQTTSQPVAPNVVPVSVARGVRGLLNIPTVSVTICAPGTGNCQTVDNVQVDTESFGLRILASALPASVSGALPASAASGGGTLAECTTFVDGSFMWGSVRSADVKLGGETAAAIPVHVVGDLSPSVAPAICQNASLAMNTPDQLGANGILGIGVAPTDCPQCVDAAQSIYYACPDGGGSCANQAAVPLAQQVATPVAHFATNNNGVILQMPALGAGGAPSAAGTLTFGIGTQSNNALGASQKLTTDPTGNFDATFNGARITAFIDSGSNGYFFDDSALAPCTGDYHEFYCPSSVQTLSAALTGIDGASGASVNFDVANAESLYKSGNFAVSNLAGPIGSPTLLDFGLPFFYGRTVYYGYDQTASGGQQPFVAF